MSAIRRTSLAALAVLLPLAAACGGSPKAAGTTGTVTTQSGAVAVTPGSGTPAPSVIPTVAPETTTPVSTAYADGEEAFRAGRYDDAATIFNAYSERHPDNVWGYYMHGLAAWKSGDLNEADEAFSRALDIEPEHMKTLLNSTRVLLELGRTSEALDRVTSALQVDSTNADALRLLGRVREELGDTSDAIAAYRQALSLNERDVWAMNNLGLIYLEQGHAEDALRPLARAVELRSNAPVFQNNLGIALERTGHIVEARKAFGAALAADSGYGKASVSLARVNAASDAGSAPVDLAAVAQQFATDVRMWSESTTVARDSGAADDSAQVSERATDSAKAVGDSR